MFLLTALIFLMTPTYMYALFSLFFHLILISPKEYAYLITSYTTKSFFFYAIDFAQFNEQKHASPSPSNLARNDLCHFIMTSYEYLEP